MFNSLYPVISVVFATIFLFVLGMLFAIVFQILRKTPVEPSSRAVRWVCAGVVLVGFSLAMKYIKPIYWGFIAGMSLFVLFWGFLTKIRGRFIWKDAITFSFWFPPKITHFLKSESSAT